MGLDFHFSFWVYAVTAVYNHLLPYFMSPVGSCTASSVILVFSQVTCMMQCWLRDLTDNIPQTRVEAEAWCSKLMIIIPLDVWYFQKMGICFDLNSVVVCMWTPVYFEKMWTPFEPRCSFPVYSFIFMQWNIMDAEIKIPFVETAKLSKILSLQPEIGLCALPAARNPAVLLSTFQVYFFSSPLQT